MPFIIGISGSLRRGSFNTGLLRAASSLMPDTVSLEIADIRSIPIYNGDIEQSDGIPEAVAQLKDRIANSNGILLASPEYNNSVPGVLKNAVDWLSRPPEDIPRVFGERPIAVIGASPSGFGTLLAQNAWLPIARTLQTRPWFGGRLTISRAATVFDAEGRLIDAEVRSRLQQFLHGFAEFAVSQQNAVPSNAE